MGEETGGAAMSTVGWDADPVVAATPAHPDLRDEVTADVCVIGLGGSGLAAVGAALDRGLVVVGLDAGRVAAGAAGRNGGILAPGPAIGAAAGAQRWGLPALRELYRATAAEIDHLEALLGPGVIRRTGGLRLVEPRWEGALKAGHPDRRDDVDSERADALEQQRVLAEIGVAARVYDGPLGTGVLVPGDAAMNPARRALGLAARYAGRAALYEHSPVLGIEPGRVRTARGSVSAGAVLVAVDGRLPEMLPELTGRIRTVRLQMLATAPVAPGVLPCPVHLRWGYDYAQQDAEGRIFIGGGRDHFRQAEETTDIDPTPPVQQWIQRQAERLAGGPVTVTHRWAASAGYTDDGVPLVVRVRDGVVACGGYNGMGNLVGPIAARAALALALDGTAPPAWFTGPD
jgi:glycine/D-amino acid oxidase-like deaminating enzyme